MPPETPDLSSTDHQMERRLTIRRNAIYNLVGYAVPIALTLVTIPIFISYLGVARYGVLTLVWALTGYMLAFNFGIGPAITYEIAKRVDMKDAAREEIFWTGILLALGYSVAGAIVMYGLAFALFEFVFKMPDEIRAEVTSVLPWIAAAVPFSVLEGLFVSALIGRERFLTVNISRSICAPIAQILPLFAIIAYQPTLDVAVPAMIIGKAIATAVVTVIAFRAVPAGIRPKYSGHADARTMFSYGGWTSLGTFSKQLLLNTDRVIIGWLLGSVSVAFYAVPANLTARLSVLPRALSEALFPRISQSDETQRAKLATSALRVNNAFAIAAAGTMSLAVTPFLSVWIGQEFATKAGFVGQLLALSFYLACGNAVATTLLTASGRPKDPSVIMFSQIIPFAICLYFGILWYGLVGAACARILNQLIEAYRINHRAGTLRLMLLPSAIGLGILGCTLLVSLLPFAEWSVADIAVRLAGISAICLYSLWLAPELLKLIPARLQFWKRSA